MGQIHNVVQGSTEWESLRAKRYTASEAAAMMGASKYQSRSELLRQKATGETPEVSPQQQKAFDDGHKAEAAARPKGEAIIGEEIFPATATEDFEGLPLLASSDGLTLLGDTAWEHKLWSQSLADQVEAGELEDHYVWQLEQVALVTGAERILFMASDGTEDRCAWMWYTPQEGYPEALVAGWRQFHEDLQNYQPREEKPEPTGKAPEDLPALRVEVQGAVTDSNLATFKEHALAVFEGINTELTTDEDFANADKTAKWCSEVEKRLEAAKQHALSQTESIDQLFRTIDEIKEQARQTRLDLDKKVKARKQAIRDEILQENKDALAKHIESINESLDGATLPDIPADFAGAMKGKKTVKSLRDAAETELARAKIAANEWGYHIRANLKRLAELTEGYESLFAADRTALVRKWSDDMEAVVKARIAEHQAEQERRQEAERAQQKNQSDAEQPRPASPTPAEPTGSEVVEWDISCRIAGLSSDDATAAKNVERELRDALSAAGFTLQDVLVQRAKEAA